MTMMSLQELRKHEWIKFADCRTNVKDKKSGAKVGKYLAVSGYGERWKLFQIYGGIPVIDNWITSLEDAVKIARYIDQEYNEYLNVWQTYPDWDLIGIARLSVPNGEAIYETICKLQELGRDINYQDFERIYKERLLQHEK